MRDLFEVKIRVFVAFLIVLALVQLTLIFFQCAKFGFYGSFLGVAILLGLVLTIAGFITNRLWGWMAGIAVFSFQLFYFYYFLITSILVTPNFQMMSIPINLLINLSGILITTSVYGIFILYVISTRNYFKGRPSRETVFHKIMFIFLLFSFIGSLFLVYQHHQEIVCPDPYTFDETERFSTPENTLITSVEAYFNRDPEVLTDTTFYSEEFKRKLERSGTDLATILEIQRKEVQRGRIYDKIDHIEITKKESITENEVYIEYISYFRKVKDAAVRPPIEGADYLINVHGEWKLNPEPLFDEDFKQKDMT